MKNKTNILTKAGALLVAVFMVLTVVPSVTAESADAITANQKLVAAGFPSIPQKPVAWGHAKLDQQEAFSGSFADEWYYVHNGAAHDATLATDSISLTGAGTMMGGVTLDLSAEIGNQITMVSYCDYADGTGAGLELTAKVYEGDLGGSPTLIPSATTTTTTTDSGLFEDITLAAPVDIEAPGIYSIVFEAVQDAASQFVFAVDSGPSVPGGDWISLDGSTWEDMGDAYGFDYNWLFEAYVEGAGPSGPDCLEDQCDFAIEGLCDSWMDNAKPIDVDGDGNADYNVFGSWLDDFCINITNKGEIGISELKLMVDVYEKVCGPTITVYDDPKYDLMQFPCCGDNYPFDFPDDTYVPIGDEPYEDGGYLVDASWHVEDDNDGDSWALQAYKANTDEQSWRNTKGKDRSFGVDEDVYLGLSEFAPEDTFDTLRTPIFNADGAACADISFTHWTEGEYCTDADGNIIPVDYGTLEYTINGGTNWTAISTDEFVAYDNDWEAINIKFINTIYEEREHKLSWICDGCEPEEDDILIMENLTDAEIALRFVWHKDPCFQKEGWYIDDLQFSRTEDYNLKLIHQTHDIIEMDPCEGTIEWQDFNFPLGWDPEEDTWYHLDIIGQVFSPSGCEQDITNNQFSMQFKVSDIHDVRCVPGSLEVVDGYSTDMTPGDSIKVKATVQNVGTYPESCFPVDLQVGDLIVNQIAEDNFETNSLGDYSIYYFNLPLGATLVPWRWSKGDASISNIYTSDPAQARSRNPGSECLVGAQEGAFPVLLEDSCSVIAADVIELDPNHNWVASGNQPDCDDPINPTMTFDAKWSMEIGEDTYYGGYYAGTLGTRYDLAVAPTEGPGAGYIVWVTIPKILNDIAVDGYENDWQALKFDLHEVVGSIMGLDFGGVTYNELGYMPACEIGISVYAEGPATEDGINLCPAAPNGGTSNPFNPIPWTGFLVDNLRISTVSVDDSTLETVDTQFVADGPGEELLYGETEELIFEWDNATLCAHGLQVKTQLETDENPNNDRCCTIITHVTEEERCFDHFVEDLTVPDNDCLWHACTNREGGDDYFAWAGVEGDNCAQYTNNMNQALVSPTTTVICEGDCEDEPLDFKIDLRNYEYFWTDPDAGFAVNISTWYEFAAGDLGTIDIWCEFDHDSDPETPTMGKWVQIGKVQMDSNGVFEDKAFVVNPSNAPFNEMVNRQIDVRFRMFSDEEKVAQGWYVDDFRIVEVDGLTSAAFATDWLTYNDGVTDNAFAWNNGNPWIAAIELDQAKLGSYAGTYDLTDVRVSTGCDDYGFYATPYNIHYYVGTAPSFTGATLIGSGTGSTTGWTTASVAPQTMPTADSAFVIVEWYGYGSGFPAGFDTDSFDDRGGHTLEDSSGSWILLDDLGYDAVYGIDAGLEIGGGAGAGNFLDTIPVLTWMDDTNDVANDPCCDGPELPDYPYENNNGIGSQLPHWDTFERGTTDPWTCEPVVAGQYWVQWTDVGDESTLPNDECDDYADLCEDCDPGWYTIPSEELVSWGYTRNEALNDALAIELDLTDPTLDPNYIRFCADINYDLSNEEAFIEFSPDWDGESPMNSATWVEYWHHTPGDRYGDDTEGHPAAKGCTPAWVSLEDMTTFGDPVVSDRWLIDEYAGQRVFVRFRLQKDMGDSVGEGFAVDNVHLKVKHTGEAFADEEPPQTSIYFDEETAEVTLVAVDYPLNKGSGVDATYYKINGGETQEGVQFVLDEGTNTVEYWSVDNAGNEETHKTAEFTVDTTAPTVEIVTPEEGGIYLLGNKVLSLGSKAFAIGKLPVVAEASDEGSGVDKVLFSFSNGDSGFDDDGAPYDYTFRAMHFGSLTISAVAIDNNGLTSSPDEMTVTVFSLGLL